MSEEQLNQQAPSEKYTMTISRLTVDKLGMKLYDKVSAALAELVANGYDADATEVEIKAPMGQFLATKGNDKIIDNGYVIEVRDNGIGMTPEQINEFYLRVGAERRRDSRRGDTSKKYNRKVMGRKGVGKLAPFGICERIEVISTGGDAITYKDDNGQQRNGYKTAHLILDRSKILDEVDVEYHPNVGEFDESFQSQTGTLLRLSVFTRRRVPTLEDMNRQLAQRFGIHSADWKITLIDSTKDLASPDYSREVGQFDIPKMEGTGIRFDLERDRFGQVIEPARHRAFSADDSIRTDLEAGFWYENKFYPITGWVAYAKQNYKDDLMAGVRIYCRGKIAAQTPVFNLKSGFEGEHSVRSYFVGELNVDWLDEEEDLIQTDRRDILWSHDLGQAFEQWGQSVVKQVGKMARDPMKKKTWEVFKEVSDVERKIEQAFPLPEQKPIREQALEFAKLVGKTMREGEISDPEQVEAVVQLSLTLAPHVTLDEKLREAANATDSPLSIITDILRTARVAELSSFGRIADDRIKVIGRVEALKDDSQTLEAILQELIQQAPWLIDPQWTPITANQSFTTLRDEFAKYYKSKTGQDLYLNNFTDPTKRMDFVLSNQDSVIQIIEIKRPNHNFENEEMDRLDNYLRQMENFLKEPSNQQFVKVFSSFHATLVCDGEKLTGVHKTAFDSRKEKGCLTWINWTTFLARTRKMHEEFLLEAERQKRAVGRTS